MKSGRFEIGRLGDFESGRSGLIEQYEEFIRANRALIRAVTSEVFGQDRYRFNVSKDIEKDIESVAFMAFFAAFQKRRRQSKARFTSIFYNYLKKFAIELRDTGGLVDVSPVSTEPEKDMDRHGFTSFEDNSTCDYAVALHTFQNISGERLRSALRLLSGIKNRPWKEKSDELLSLYGCKDLAEVAWYVRQDLAELQKSGWRLYKALCANGVRSKVLVCARSIAEARETLRGYGILLDIEPFTPVL